MDDLVLMKHCIKCGEEKPIVEFRTIHNKETKQCQECRRECITRYKCEHGKIKYQCRACSGQSLCQHGYQRTQCRRCLGSGLCSHNIQKDRCVLCGNAEKIRIMTMIQKSRQVDIKKGRYDANNFIDYPFIEQMMFERRFCCYCNVEMIYDRYCNELCSIERKDNNIGHTRENCTLCCLGCNRKRVGQWLEEIV